MALCLTTACLALAAGVASTPAAVLVDLDATGEPLGALSTWANNGSLGDFTSSGTQTPEVIDRDGVRGLQFLGGTAADEGTSYIGPIAPASVVLNNSRTVEAWILNDTPQTDENVFSWGRRDAGDGALCALNHGSSPDYGAASHFGAGADVGYDGNQAFGRWTYIAYTYDSSSNLISVYFDGMLANTLTYAGVNTPAVDSNGGDLPFRVQRENNNDGTVSGAGLGEIVIARIRVHDTAMTDAEIAAQFDAEKAFFGVQDTDGDSMPDWFERRYSAFLDLTNPADAGMDFDVDQSVNSNEYALGTTIDDPDTDDDGALDGSETDTGAWVSATDRGTDPFDPDTDNDTLLDGVESNTHAYVSPADTGTNPLETDSDTDTWDDGGEVILGSDPNDPDDFPIASSWNDAINGSMPKYWWKLNETTRASAAINDGTEPGVDGEYNAGITDADLSVNGVLETQTGTAVEFTGPPAGNATTKLVDISINAPDPDKGIEELVNVLADAVTKTTTVEYWFNTSSPGTHGDNTWQNPSILARESPGQGDMYWGNFPADGSFLFSSSDTKECRVPGMADGEWHHVVMVKEWVAGTPIAATYLYMDGGELEGGTTIRSQSTAQDRTFQDPDSYIWYAGMTQNGDGDNVQYIGKLDELAIYNRALTESEARLHYRAIAFADTDMDGMPDFYEDAHGLQKEVNDAGDDLDVDGATNLREFEDGTDPQVQDTDGDGVFDGPETGTGVWVSPTDRGTDPLDTDSDDDGLSDGVEENDGNVVGLDQPGTDPNTEDTDMDGFRDRDEILIGTSPVNMLEFPIVAPSYVDAVTGDAPLYFWRFENATVGEGVANEGSVAGFDGAFSAAVADSDLGKPSASAELGSAWELTGPAVGAYDRDTVNNMTKFVTFTTNGIPELINLRSAPAGKSTTVEYWIKTTHVGTHGQNNWQSPALIAHESPGDGDMYWGVIDADGAFAYSTSDAREAVVPNLADGAWHHIMMVKTWPDNDTDRAVSRLYVDGGAAIGGVTIETTTSSGDASRQDDDSLIDLLGYTEFGEQENVQFIGMVDEVAIYNTELSQAHAQMHYLAAAVAAAGHAVTSISIDGSGNPVVTWDAIAGVSNTVERATDLVTGNWTGIVTDDSGTATDTNPPLPAAHYRVQ